MTAPTPTPKRSESPKSARRIETAREDERLVGLGRSESPKSARRIETIVYWPGALA